MENLSLDEQIEKNKKLQQIEEGKFASSIRESEQKLINALDENKSKEEIKKLEEDILSITKQKEESLSNLIKSEKLLTNQRKDYDKLESLRLQVKHDSESGEREEAEKWDSRRKSTMEALTDPKTWLLNFLKKQALDRLEYAISKKKRMDVAKEKEEEVESKRKSDNEMLARENEYRNAIEDRNEIQFLSTEERSEIQSIPTEERSEILSSTQLSVPPSTEEVSVSLGSDDKLDTIISLLEGSNETQLKLGKSDQLIANKQLRQDKDQWKADQRISAKEEAAAGIGKKLGGLKGIKGLGGFGKKGKGKEGEEEGGFFSNMLSELGGDIIGNALGNKFGKGKGLLGKGKGLLGKGKGILPKGLGMLKHIPKFGMGMGGMGTALASGGSAVASGGSALATGAAGMASSAMSGIGAFAAANPIGAAVLATAAIGAGAYMLWDSMRGSDEAKEAFDAAEDAGLVDHDVIGDSEILDWEGIKKLSPKAIDGLIEYDDWSNEDMKRLKEIKETGDFDDGSKKKKKKEEKEKIDDSTSSEGLSTNLPPAIGTSGVLGKLFDYSPIGMMSNALGLTTSESDKEKQRKAGNLDYTDKLDTIISLMGGKEISTKKGGYFGVGAEGDMPADFNKGKSLLDYKDFDDFEANAPEALKSEHFDIMDNEDFNLSKREARMESKLVNNMPGFNEVDSGVPGKGVKTKNLIAGAEKGTPETEWMRSLGLKPEEMVGRSGGLLSGIGSFFTGKEDGTIFEKLYDNSMLGGITNMLGLTTSKSEKEKQKSIPKNDAEQIKLNYKEGSAQEKKASEEIKKLRGENANIDYGDEFGTNIEFKNPEVQKNYDRLLKLEQAGRLQKNQAVDAQAQSMMKESTGFSTDDELQEKYGDDGWVGDIEIERSMELRNKIFLENVGISEDETGQNWKNERLIEDMAENSLKDSIKDMPMPEQVQHDVIAGSEKGTPETEFVEKFRNEYGENDKLMGGGLLSGIGSFFTGKEDGGDESTVLGGITNMLGLTTSESNKETQPTKEYKKGEEWKEYRKPARNPGNYRSEEAADEKAKLEYKARGMKSGETRRLVAGEVVGEELTEQQYGAFSASQSMGNPIAPDDMKKMEAYRNKPKPKLANNMPGFNGPMRGGLLSGIGSFFTGKTEDGEEKDVPLMGDIGSLSKSPLHGLLSGIGSFFTGKTEDGEEKDVPLMGDIGSLSKSPLHGLLSGIGSFFTGKTEDGEDESTIFEKAYDNSKFGRATNFLGLTTSESDKEKQKSIPKMEDGETKRLVGGEENQHSVTPLNDNVTGKLSDQDYLDDIQSYKDRIMSWGKGDMTDMITMNDGTIIDYSYWKGQKYKWHDGDLTEMYEKLKSGQEIKIGMNAIPKDDEHLNPFNPSFFAAKKMDNTPNILASNIKVGDEKEEMPQVIPNEQNQKRKSEVMNQALQKGMDNNISGTQGQNGGSSGSQTNISAPTINSVNNTTNVKKEATYDTDVTTRGLNKSAMMFPFDDF
jgi:hypothetical protein